MTRPTGTPAPGHQRNQRVVDDQRVIAEAESPHHASDGGGIVITIDAGNAQAHGHRPIGRAVEHLIDHFVQRSSRPASSPCVRRLAPPARPSATTCPSSLASSATVLLPPASIPSTCIVLAYDGAWRRRVSCNIPSVATCLHMPSPSRWRLLVAAVLRAWPWRPSHLPPYRRQFGQQDVRALWVTRATLNSPACGHPDGALRRGRAASTRSSCRCAAAATPTTAARSNRARPSSRRTRTSIRWRRPSIRRTPQGLQVHAWVAVNLVSSAATLPSSREHVVYKHPDWLMVPKALAVELRGVDTQKPGVPRTARPMVPSARRRGRGPVHVAPPSAAAAHVAAVVRELVTGYAARWRAPRLRALTRARTSTTAAPRCSSSSSRCSRISRLPRHRRLRAREALDPLAYPNFFPERWKAFRRSRLTALVMRVRTAVKEVRPDGDRQRGRCPGRGARPTSRGCRTGARGSISR